MLVVLSRLTFPASLPPRNQPAMKQTRLNLAPTVATSPSPQILLVDASKTFLKAACQTLQEAGYAVDTAKSVCCAEVLLERRQYDLMITGIEAEIGEWFDLIEYVRKKKTGFPIVVMAAEPLLETAVKCIELSVACLLPKTAAQTEILEKIESILFDTHHLRAVLRIRRQLEICAADLTNAVAAEPFGRRDRWGGTRWIPAATLQALAGCLEELVTLESETTNTNRAARYCELLQCPVWRCHRNAIHDCILLLHETKRRFKSKELAQIRQTLEELMQTFR